MIITSVNNQLIKDTTKLHQKKHRDSTGLFLIEGYHLYEEAEKVGNIRTVFTTDEAITGDKVIYVTDIILEKLTQTKSPQKILTVCEKIKANDLTDKVLICEKIQDPGNLGTLMRSALAFGFNTIILSNTVDIYNDKVLRGTQGAIFKLNIIEMNTTDFIDKNPEYKVYGTSLNGTLLRDIKTSDKLALVLGNEGSGISDEILKKTDENITINIVEVESLNVGVAGSIIMHYLMS
jgi:TrmH family RNA methyltransferase